MKRLSLFALVLLVGISLAGCWGSNLESYAMGRSMYYGIEATVSSGTIDRLEDRFNQLLAETAGVVMVEPTQTMALYTDMAMIMSGDVKNPYGLMGDLTFLLSESGAEYGQDGGMLSVNPIPREMFVAFSMGWKNSKYEMSSRR